MLQALVRLLMNAIAGALMAKGIGDSSTWETISAGVLAAAALGWSSWHQRSMKSVAKQAAVSDCKPDEKPTSTGGPPSSP